MNTTVLVATSSSILPSPQKDSFKFLIRTAALAVAVAGHALFLYVPQLDPVAPAAVETLEITVIAQGDATNDNAEETQSATEMAPPPEPEPAPLPEPQQTPVEKLEPAPLPEPQPEANIAVPPLKEDATAMVIPIAKPELPPLPQIAPQPMKPRPRKETRPKPKKVVTPSVASAALRRAHAGAAQGELANSGLSVATYGAALKAEINRHKSYPAAARDRKTSGVALVSFSVGPSGRLSGISIARSSGDAILDAAALQAVRSANPPPPPGGRFSGRIAIEFALKRG